MPGWFPALRPLVDNVEYTTINGVTVEVAQSNRLPGGLPGWQGWWVLARDGGLGAAFTLLPLLLITLLMAAAGIVDRDPTGLVFLAAPLVVAGLATWWHRPGAAVTAQTQPEVHALVTDAARRVGVPMPERVWPVGEGPCQVGVQPYKVYG